MQVEAVYIGVLPAQTELIIPVTVERIAAGRGGDVPCNIQIVIFYAYWCADEYVEKLR